MANYAVKKIFPTLQGEGAQAGRAAVFCRFAGCNLWSGRDSDRATAACRFCDTDFVGVSGPGGGFFATADALGDAIAAAWRGGELGRYVVFTGGEPLLQVDAALIEAAHRRGFAVAVETNGTIAPPPGVDWLCVSPKAGAPFIATRGSELKLVFPQVALSPDALAGLDFQHLWLQPMDGAALRQNIASAAAYCLAHPPWRLSLQTHKMIGIP